MSRTEKLYAYQLVTEKKNNPYSILVVMDKLAKEIRCGGVPGCINDATLVDESKRISET